MSFKGLIAAASTNEPWDNQNACISGVGTTNTDYIIVEYQIDGGAYTPLIRFYNRGSASGTSDKYLYEDTDGNGCGDGIMLTNAFAEFTKTITGTGTTLNLRIRVFSEGNNEEWGIDNFRLFETPTCTAPAITGNPPNRTVCAGSNTTFSVTATGATGYQWQVNTGSGFTNLSNGAPYSNVTTNTLTITGVTAGMSGYLYRCVPYNGTASCFTNSNSGTLTVSSISSTSSKTDVSCFGGANGSAAIVPTGGIGPYTYSWSPSGGTGAIATGLTAGTYTCTITDNIGCTATRTVTINQPATAINGTTVVTNVACNGGATGAINLTPTGGTGPYTYNWGGGITTEDRTGLTAGSYSVTITDANGCTGTVNATVTQPGAAISGTTVVTNVACNGGNTGAINLTPTGGTGPYTYNWGGGITTEDRTGLTAGSYSVTITDANGCTGTVSGIVVTQPTALNASAGGGKTDVSCFGGSNGTATVAPTGGTAPYTYSWAPSGGTAATATGLAAGTYTVTVTDNNACQTTRSFTINQPTAALSVATGGGKTDVSCFGGSNGTATVAPTGGTAPYTYSWAPSGGTAATATGLAAGTYTVTVTDSNACQTTRSFTINQPTTALSAATGGGKTDVSCFGGSNGTATVAPTGGTAPYTYSWAPSGGTAATATGLAAGTYTVTVTDSNACQTTRSFTINQPTTALSAATGGGKTDVSCFGGSNGTATVAPTGGTAPYTYSWAPSGGTAATATGLAAGTYTVTVTDNNGCQTTRSFTINQPTALTATTSKTDVSCNGGANGTATVSVTGGTSSYTYSWAPSGGTAATATGLAAGTYTCTITDANSCQITRSVTVTEPATIDNTVSVSGATVTAIQNGASYQWIDCDNGNAIIPGATNQSFTPAISGNYAVIITISTCSATSICTNVLDTVNFEPSISLLVYPNPAKGIVTVKTNFDGRFQIVNQLGQIIKNFETTSGGEKTIDLENAAEGIYYLIGQSNEGKTIQKKIILDR